MGSHSPVVESQRYARGQPLSLIAYVNGRFLPLEDAYIHIEDRGFQFADGVYEVAACFSGRFFELDAHLARLARSCNEIGISMPTTKEELAALVREAYQRNRLDDALIYIQVTRGSAPRLHVPNIDTKPTLVITVRPFPFIDEDKARRGVKAITQDDIRWKRCDIKSIALLANVMGKMAAHKVGAYEALWLDCEGHVLEGSSTNVFAVIHGALITHPADHHILAGITRSLVIKLAKEEGMQVFERPWRLNEDGISECMISSTTNAVLPIVEVDGKKVGDGTPGPVAQKLRQSLLLTMKGKRQPS